MAIFNMELPDNLRERIDTRADALGLSAASFIKLAVAEKLEREGLVK